MSGLRTNFTHQIPKTEQNWGVFGFSCTEMALWCNKILIMEQVPYIYIEAKFIRFI